MSDHLTDLPADTSTPASLVPDVPTTSSFSYSRDFRADTDWFRVSLEANRPYRISLEGFNGTGELKNVYTANGDLLYRLDSGGFGSSGFAVPQSGEYFIAVSTLLIPTGSQLPDPEPYTLTLMSFEPDAPGPDTESAAPLTVDGPDVSGSLGFIGDVDTYVFDLIGGRYYTVEIALPTSNETNRELVLRSRDSTEIRQGIPVEDYSQNEFGFTTGSVFVEESGRYTLSFSDASMVPEGLTSYEVSVEDLTDTIRLGTEAPEIVEGTVGNDTIDVLAGDDIVVGGSGADELVGSAGDDVVSGQAGNDLLFGGIGDDTLAGGTGSDNIFGGDGHDSIGGGEWEDRIFGGSGNDTIGAGLGYDTVFAGAGDDVVSGGAKADDLNGGDGSDTIGGSYDDDRVFGGDGDDSIGGGTGADDIYAGAGHDIVGGGRGRDFLRGEAGNDFLAGGGRFDRLEGGAGADTLNGGAGNDTLFGGTGADVFAWNTGDSGVTDVIRDFEDGTDLIRLTSVSNAPGSGLPGRVAELGIVDTIYQEAQAVSIDYQGQTILVAGLSAADLTVEDFIFL